VTPKRLLSCVSDVTSIKGSKGKRDLLVVLRGGEQCVYLRQVWPEVWHG